MTKLAPGQQPPQFVVVSFDGACKHDLMQHYRDLAASVGGHFTFFLSGLCVLPDAQRFAYRPPRKPVGTSAIGFGDASLIEQRIADWGAAYREGHEIGSHFLGHFCDSKGVGTWSAADWQSEIDQFDDFVDNWQKYNPGVSGSLPFTTGVIHGGRTPCLAGKRDQYLPVFAHNGWTYDSSGTGSLRWPTYQSAYRLWEIPMQTVKIAGYGKSAISMDYNFLYAQNKAAVTAPKATCDRIRQSTYQTYQDALNAVYAGNRAPLILGNHFNTWVCGAYRDALTSFITDTHAAHPDVRFVSFDELVQWLDAQDPQVLKALQRKGTQSYVGH